ncbi:MAG: YgiQ family radical SAM protein [Bacteroidales bacterium]|nr:YgiQ family radical SAM protein [Bacteroidales bacterium]
MGTGKITDWLPTSVKELKERGWDEPDVILFTGDAYVDHPSFGAAVIGRIIEKHGFKVAIVPQPNWRDDLRDFKKLGKPRMFFGVSAGCMDSMVNHYTANKRLRSDDAYTPGGKSGFRPDYAVNIYTGILKKLYPDVPVVIGGIEASMRRLTHYDYWQDKLLPGILVTSGADLLIYGMGEKPLTELLHQLSGNIPFGSLKTIRQTAWVQSSGLPLPAANGFSDIEIAPHEACLADKKIYASNFKIIEEESNKIHARRIHQLTGNVRIVINPPYTPMDDGELDSSFDLPYTRLPHPRYNNKGAIPAFEMIKFSVNLHRGCFGGCSFCAISAHQGKFIASRSKKSILNEVRQIIKMPGFKGYITDLGGPSANMYKMKGHNLLICEKCKRPSCIFPSICQNLNTSHSSLLEIYRAAEQLPEIKKVFIGSGIRYDLLLDKNAPAAVQKSHSEYINELVSRHVSGRLKVAPEHTSQKVLCLMRKPPFELFNQFKLVFESINNKEGLNQQLIPYFISSHPGSCEEDMALLAIEAKNNNFRLEQVQDFTPTPMTLATVIFYSGYHPYTLEKVFTARTKDEKLNQRMYFFWYKPEFRQKIEDRLRQIGRSDIAAKLFRGKTNKNNQAPFKADKKHFRKAR